ncbi:hypothetical protein [Microbacterium sp. SORGH_AS_0888]|uniref:hypothetical protein n=1 Tax=Microbacterium sp. SORGH_AS_0888 TaxID=3041791 RepID=UPI00278A5512|nr:hypothetical protein [Microbacterium sp. SORGH_AS_0888]MDQ1131132.1 hypothetical protein [Microbacterium sp. SORGH_AS_0888]
MSGEGAEHRRRRDLPADRLTDAGESEHGLLRVPGTIAGTIILAIAVTPLIGLVATGSAVLLLPLALAVGAGGSFVITGLVGRSYLIQES